MPFASAEFRVVRISPSFPEYCRWVLGDPSARVFEVFLIVSQEPVLNATKIREIKRQLKFSIVLKVKIKRRKNHQKPDSTSSRKIFGLKKMKKNSI